MKIEEFLLARIAEDEAAAREWCSVLLTREVQEGWKVSRIWAFETGPGDPVRVIRQCEAMRKTVQSYVDLQAFGGDERMAMRLADRIVELKQVLEAFASLYSNHPDYSPTWRYS